MTIDRRKLLKSSAFAGIGGALLNSTLFAAEDAPNPKSNKFLLYIHLGSSCGAANGLLQPIAPGAWPKGFFRNGVEASAANPLLNMHTQAGGLVLHDYLKFLAPMANDMCLVEGSSQSLDHNVAAILQKRGATTTSTSPEWGMGVTQFMKTDKKLNPMAITSGNKTASVSDITTVQANTLAQFKDITTDVSSINSTNMNPIWDVLKNRFKSPGLSSVLADSALASSSSYQLDVLKTGLPELNDKNAQADIAALKALFENAELNKIVAGCAEKNAIQRAIADDRGFVDKLMLAGILAKTGLAHGMTIDAMGEDRHNGGADVHTARSAAAKWASISVFWNWIKAAGLQNDVMIVIGQEFARSPYNSQVEKVTIVNEQGANVEIACPGRDHSLAMGTMFIHGNVPKAGRVGFVGDNMAPQATKDAKGTIDSANAAFTSENIVGSMLLRCFDDLFPTERIVRKHWPAFKEIGPILA